MSYGKRDYHGQRADHKGRDFKCCHESVDSDGAVMDCVVEDRRGSSKGQHNVNLDDNSACMSESEIITHTPTYSYHSHGQHIEYEESDAKYFHESKDSDGAVMDYVVEDGRCSSKRQHNIDDNSACKSDNEIITHIPVYRYHSHGQRIEYEGSDAKYSYDTMDSDGAVMDYFVENSRYSSKNQHNIDDYYVHICEKKMITRIPTGQRIEYKGSDVKYSYDTMDSDSAVMGVFVEDRRGSSKRQVQFTLFGALAETFSMLSNQYTGDPQDLPGGLDGSSGTSSEGYPFITQTKEPEERDRKFSIDIKSCRAAMIGVTGAMIHSCLDSFDHHTFYPIA